MKCVLLNPPLSSPFSPPLGLVSLGTYLRRQGIDVTLVDASIEALHYRLAPHRLLPAAERGAALLQRRVPWEPALPACDRLSNRANPAAAMQAVHGILPTIWSRDAFELDPARHDEQLETIHDALILSTADAQPAALGLGGYDEARASFAPGSDPFLDYYREVPVPAVVEAAPDVVGVSIGYERQVAFAATIIAELRRKLSGVPIITGGSLVSALCIDLRPSSGRTVPLRGGTPTCANLLASMIDTAAVDGEGEAPMAATCRAIAAGRSLDGIAGVVRVDHAAQTIRFGPPSPPLAGEALPSLDLEGLPIGRKYLGPVRAAPLMTSRGCY